jgi:sugar fermentation stimulation protein A
MKFESTLVRGTFERRYKRFFADVRLESGEVVTAHCPNTGSMRSCIAPGWPVLISPANNPKRKLQWTLEVSCAPTSAILVNTARPNRVVEAAILSGDVPELTGYGRLRREVKYGQASRIDLLLEDPPEGRPAGQRCLIEVKNLTLRTEDGLGAFPDAVTTRGKKHLEELTICVGQGDRAVQFFLVPRVDVDAVRPADEIDPAYGSALRRAAAAGVEILAYQAEVTAEGVQLGTRLPVRL